MDPGNYVTFYGNVGNQTDVELFSFDPADVIGAINGDSMYRGNPNYNSTDPAYNQGSNSGEPYVFLNFYATGDVSFSKIVFTENGGGGYESDNHTVGIWQTITGTLVDLQTSQGLNGVTPFNQLQADQTPEPATWTLAFVGFSLIGASLRLRRRSVRSELTLA